MFDDELPAPVGRQQLQPELRLDPRRSWCKAVLRQRARFRGKGTVTRLSSKSDHEERHAIHARDLLKLQNAALVSLLFST